MKKRFSWIDYARGFAIIMIVFRHVVDGFEATGMELDPLYEKIQMSFYNIRMPLFFLISGFFIRKSILNRSVIGFNVHKIRTILYPYLVWASLQLSLQIILQFWSNSNHTIWDFANLIHNPFAVKSQFWFLWTLFFVCVLFSISKHLNISKNLNIFIALGLNLLSTYVMYKPIENIMFYYLFLSVGDWVSSWFISNQKALTENRSFIPIMFIFICMQVYWMHNLDLKETNTLGFDMIAIWGSLTIFVVSSWLNQRGYLKFINWIGKHSLYIYLTHVIIQAGFRTILIKSHIMSNLSMIIITTIGAIFLPILVKEIAERKKLMWMFQWPEPKKEPQYEYQKV